MAARLIVNLNSGKESLMDLKGSETEGNLKAAFAGESQANRRYLYFASKADVEGYNDCLLYTSPSPRDRG